MGNNTYDAVIIGGGMYGCTIANHLATQHKLKRIALVEKSARLFSRASWNNQARVHNGYHYPRSYTTAFRSRVNLPKFLNDYPSAIESRFTKIYAIAKNNSKVTANQFIRFCTQIGASFEQAPPNIRGLFNQRLIENVFQVEEYAFNAAVLAELAQSELQRNHVDLQLNSRVTDIQANLSHSYDVEITNDKGITNCLKSKLVFNCTYSGLNHVSDNLDTSKRLKHEITEMALVSPPETLGGLGITIMDGPFFSCMPFPAKALHTLSHVRYTPHQQWEDQMQIDPYQALKQYEKRSRANRMIRDASRYVPAMAKVVYKSSLFEIKTILTKNETDDGRPILFESHKNLPGCYSVLGGKIDNIYDILGRIDSCLQTKI